MEIDHVGLKHFGLDGEPLMPGRVGEFLKIPGVVVDELAPGQHIDFVTLRVRNEGRGIISFAKTQHVFLELLKLEPGEAFLLYCTCPMVDKFLVVTRDGDVVKLIYKRL
ncbi:hypothetical protein [Pyrobaculum ferrireducens]|uniref:Uncharacterized protein n=1 Tax=Pyrobaculum ferrireducens TaxID=1104324 RepID=G7VHI2_9CREN|nr:hypothetical protein [Pyrobaculum ferrireducens]AET33273.1 hypothetical protein P186_1871 [Pyrobaculum ferrireducens]